MKSKLFAFVSLFCFVFSVCILSVFAVSSLQLNSGGTIEFVAPGIDATISQATLTGVTAKEGSGQMKEFSITPQMTADDIRAISEYQSWSGIHLIFDEETNGQASISFTITNNSEKNIENIMVELSSNTTSSSSIVATPSADFCITPGASHTFTILLTVADTSMTTSLKNFVFTVEMNIIKPDQVVSVAQCLDNGLNFSTDDSTKTASLINYTQPTAAASTLSDTTLEIEIPKVVKDNNNNIYTVTAISDAGSYSKGAFYSVKNTLTSIVIPSTITKIGHYAFYGCSTITSGLKLPTGIITIGYYAFYSCSGYKGDIIIPKGLKTIGSYSFYSCAGLTGELIIPDDITAIGGYAFYGCSGLTGELIIPNNVKTIGTYCFAYCTGFSGELILGDSVETIDKYAFYSCTGFTSLSFNESLITIDEKAFAVCSELTSLYIPQNVKTIGPEAFSHCVKLNSIDVNKNNTYYHSIGNCLIETETKILLKGTNNSVIPNDGSVTSIAKTSFYECRELSGELVIPASVKTIGEHAFQYCTSLTSLIIEDGLTTLGLQAFYGCENLLDIDFAESVLYVDGNVFLYTAWYDKQPSGIVYLNKLLYKYKGNERTPKTVVVPDGIIALAKSAFNSCSNLTSVTLPDSVRVIGEAAFIACSSLTDIYLGKSLECIGSSAFARCSSLQSIVLPDTVTTIKAYAFEDCESLVSINIPKNLESIAGYVFDGCNLLTMDLVLPETIKTISGGGFRNCNFASITIKAVTPPTISNRYAFETSQAVNIYVPAESVEAYKNASYYWGLYKDRIFAIEE